MQVSLSRSGVVKVPRHVIPLLIAAAAGCFCFASSLRAAPPSSDYALIWEDQFSGSAGSAPNAANWRVRNNEVRRHATNLASAVSLDGSGNLEIKTWTEANGHKTGFIDTQGKFAHKYGYWEASIDFDTSPGMWSAFWNISPTIGQPIGQPGVAGTEIDVIEHRFHDESNANISNKAQFAVHWDGYGADHKSQGSLTGNLGLAGGFHTYGMKWTKTENVFYVDGTVRWTFTSAISHASHRAQLSSEVHDNIWAGDIPAGGYGSFQNSNTRMRVDYVRVYSMPLISNAGFESGTGNTAAATNDWFNFGAGSESTSIRGTGNAHSGSYSGITSLAANPAINTDHTIAQGDQFDLSFRHRNSQSAGNKSVFWELYYYTTEGQSGFDETSATSRVSLFSDEYTAGVSGDGTVWSQLIAPTTSSIGSGHAAIGKTLYLRFFRTGGDGHFPRIDDVSLFVTSNPEPSSMALLSVGGLLLLQRRRRSA